MYYTNHLGIVYGPYGSIGFVQRDDLRNVDFSFRALFRWVKNLAVL
jgi:hypothetical protein